MTATQASLTDYVRNGSDRAFRELVASYINFVFSTALRVVGGDRQLAEDVSQTVFMDLARKAAALAGNVKLGGWLHRHTCFVARKALRRERRRKARERQAVQLNVIGDYTAENLGQLAAVLDEAINDLRAEERTAILLRFFEQMDFRSLGEAVGSSEDAARMRVSRALEKLGSLLKRRGIGLSAAGLGFVLATKTVTAAPTGLATYIAGVALSSAARSGTVFSLLKEACFTRLNIGIVSMAVVLAAFIILLAPRQSEAKAESPGAAEFKDTAEDELASETVAQEDKSQTPTQPVAERPLAPAAGAIASRTPPAPRTVPVQTRAASAPAKKQPAEPSAARVGAISQRPSQPPENFQRVANYVSRPETARASMPVSTSVASSTNTAPRTTSWALTEPWSTPRGDVRTQNPGASRADASQGVAMPRAIFSGQVQHLPSLPTQNSRKQANRTPLP